MKHLSMKIEGMSCGHCVARVEKTLGRLEGVQVGKVALGSAEIDYDPERTPFAAIREALDDAGYAASPVEPSEAVA